jgi:hypothetical protein
MQGDRMTKLGCFVVAVALGMAGCSADALTTNPPQPTPAPPGGSAVEGNVKVNRVRVFIKDGKPLAFVQGELGDGCTFLDSIRQRRADRTIDVIVNSVHRGERCTMILKYLNEWVVLDEVLQPGEYTVRANGVAHTFKLIRDGGGTLRVDPDPGPVPTPPYLPVPGAEEHS